MTRIHWRQVSIRIFKRKYRFQTTNLLNLSFPDENSNETYVETENGDSNLVLNRAPESPLDDTSQRSSKTDHNNFIMDFDELAECPRDCSVELKDALSIALQDMSHIERYSKICGKYKSTLSCIHEDEKCLEEDRGMFETMMSGLHYMCVEQELAFNATIKCIDDEAGVVQAECEQQCQTKNLFMNWIMRSAFQDTIQQGVNDIVGAATGANVNPLAFMKSGEQQWANFLQSAGQPPKTDAASMQQGMENFRQFTNDLCRVGDCMLDCIRSKFNTRCEGSAGTLLSEVFVRPIAMSQNKLTVLRPVLGIFMPDQCNYVYNNAALKKHRIDSQMDTELKRMYREKFDKEIKERAAQDELLANMVPLDQNGVPLARAIPEIYDAADSPLDASEMSLERMILDKNETETHKQSNENTEEKSSKYDVKKVPAKTKYEKKIEANKPTEEHSEELESSGVASVDVEYSGESSGDTESSGERFKESSGDVEASGETSDDSFSEASGDSSGDGEASGSLEDRESSGEGSGEYEYLPLL
ncbi:unnamed protein product [Caenorhabditis bovis]|uniref:Chondroitin proteoglycan 4 domain-containing protein n=1 Tax=Caenorhabditis bovis TaxID=2654633 RepID=A0A8S1EVK9_9PELO|nr:unnamed protein product [Caenorhabditis bovis]